MLTKITPKEIEKSIVNKPDYFVKTKGEEYPMWNR